MECADILPHVELLRKCFDRPLNNSFVGDASRLAREIFCCAQANICPLVRETASELQPSKNCTVI
jgi:hypothetical protein